MFYLLLSMISYFDMNRIGFCSAMASNVTNQSRNVYSKKLMVNKEVRGRRCSQKPNFSNLILVILLALELFIMVNLIWPVTSSTLFLIGNFGQRQSLLCHNHHFFYPAGSCCYFHGRL